MTQHPREAVIYCRVSSIKQTTAGDGLKSQETRCRDYARMKGYAVLTVFSDDVSGSLTKRPGMTQMLEFIRKRRAKGTVVLIDDLSRLARGLQAHIELRATITRAGGVLESPSIAFGEDPDSLLVEHLLASVAQHQRQKNGEQTVNRMKARVQNGYWPFAAPVGYRYVRVSGRGKMIRRDEPLASIVAEALEGYAFGRFETQADVMRFLQASPIFPKDGRGLVRNTRVTQMLRNSVYAGLVEAPVWGVSLREGQHESLIALDTHRKIMNRLDGGVYAPRQPNINEDFPLRGHVLCDECGTPLTACWSRSAHGNRHPYYLCRQRGCSCYGKSVRRAVIEGEFEAMVKTLQPSETLYKTARKMLADLWDRQSLHAKEQAKVLKIHLVKVEKQVAQLLERILDASVPSVIGAYEDRIRKLEEEKLSIRERLAEAGPKGTLEDTVRTALDFLGSPWKLWDTGRLEDRRSLLKLAFAEPLRYRRGEGFRTAIMSLPFKLLTRVLEGGEGVARPKRFELLAF